MNKESIIKRQNKEQSQECGAQESLQSAIEIKSVFGNCRGKVIGKGQAIILEGEEEKNRVGGFTEGKMNIIIISVVRMRFKSI